ncbi:MULTISPECIES: SDR family oxidoreductase [Streptomyces]|uniref:3-ketoacyl-ACP reductase n=2 Tax=Streptomyces nigrescens TaxID=1920 RepID=A0A640T9A1_STRNI|nr:MULTISPECIES: SDR family oxidoreductase [Streptomyces]WAT95153.1 SDR family oxidoreductase [Streptomyces libani subsp. libani]WAU02765.1 SDR family oxidoreductase [Streptomyces nigrescens]WDT59250.1 SDR family oxidoreductase [Streptomyces sp. G7(2002)]GFE20329.1 3-ketoacyl-ACP reductase [Streptomyces libani subsp. libani]GGV86642.1 3-ketoacyl-ACP reductase [Streptomyces libani subsp. libani]
MTYDNSRSAEGPRPAPGADVPGRDPLPLLGRTALVTGASRRRGIGYAVARRLAAYGAGVYLHHHVPHDAGQPWGADPGGPDAVADGVREVAVPGAVVAHGPADLARPDAPARLLDTAAEALGGRLDILVANHALSGSDGSLDAIDAAMLDAHWAVDARSVILLAQAYARRRPAGLPGGRIVMMTSGQDLGGGMPEEIAYGLAKGALASATRSLATTFADLGVTVNTVNPGPVDTGYAVGELRERVAGCFPGGQWGAPDDPARLIAWLATDEAAWITGQVINSEGGFRR